MYIIHLNSLLWCVVHWNRLSNITSVRCLGVIGLPETYLSEFDPLIFHFEETRFFVAKCILKMRIKLSAIWKNENPFDLCNDLGKSI